MVVADYAGGFRTDGDFGAAHQDAPASATKMAALVPASLTDDARATALDLALVDVLQPRRPHRRGARGRRGVGRGR